MVVAAQLVAEVTTTGVESAQSQLEGIGTITDEVAASLSEAWTMPEESINQLSSVLIDLSNQLYDLTTVTEEVASGVEDGFAGMETAVSELSGSVSSNFSEMSTSAQESADAITTSLDSVHPSLMDMAQGAFTTYLSIQGFVQMAGQLGDALIGPDAQMEQMTVAFTTLMHSSSDAKKELQLLSNFAATTPFQMMDLDAASAKLLAFGEHSKDLIPDLTAIGDALSALGEATPARLGMIVDIFGKIDTTGKLTGGIMMQLSRDGINGWQALSDATGKSIPVLQEMVKKGLIPASEATVWLRQGLEKMYGGGMAQQAQTFNGLMSTLKDNLEAAWRSFSSPLFDKAKGALVTLGTLVSGQQFQDFATGAGQQLVGVFADMGSAVQTLRPDLDDVFSILSTLGDSVQTTARQAEVFTGGLLDAFNKSGMLQGVLQAIKDILPDVRDFLKQVGNDILSNLLPPLEKLVTNVGHAVDNFAHWLDKSGAAKQALKALGDIIGPTSQLLGTLVGWVADLVGWLGGGGVGTQTLIGVLTLLAGAFLALKIADTISGFQQMFTKLQGGDGIVSNLADSIKNKLGGAVDGFLSKQAPNLKQSLDDMKQKAKDTATAEEDVGTTAKDKMAPDVEKGASESETSLGKVETKADEAAVSEEGVGNTAKGKMAAGVDAGSTASESSLGGVEAQADTTGLSVDAIGTDAETSAAEVEAAAVEEDTALESVGAAAVGAGTEIEAIGPEASASATEAKGALGGLGGMLSNLGGLLGLINMGESQGAQSATDTWKKNHPGQKPPTFLGFASGGTNIPEGDYKVGEEGEELLHVPGGSTIYNHSQTMNMLSSSGGGNGPIIIPICIGADEIATYMVDPVMRTVMRTTNRKSGRRGL